MFTYTPCCKKCIVRPMCREECGEYRRQVNINVKVVDTIFNSMVVVAAAVLIFQCDRWFR